MENTIRDKVIAFVSDQPVDALWLGGSYGRGDNDTYSDFDFYAHVNSPAVADKTFSDLKARIMNDSSIVFSKAIVPSKTINGIDQEWRRFDISIVDDSHLPSIYKNEAKMVFDRANVVDKMGTERPPVKSQSGEIEAVTNEFIRVVGLLPVAIGRQDYVLGQSGAQILRDSLLRLMMINDFSGISRGTLSMRKSLSQENYDVMSNVPLIVADKDALINCHSYLAAKFMPLAKHMYAERGMVWPSAFEEATRDSLKKKLSLTL